ncbi:hypothetical protein [Aromatoleum buckelii]|uniref:Uncharacterized protein n=1 Tax=Aromatoleum buckelii TaxID=200254 RepID=A0ABX1N620_9RHOO|nr:hypothetical protein [Aromatoleum buckelii]MCK0509655.1 hypothetical protein [Aromatoleum buckelii]
MNLNAGGNVVSAEVGFFHIEIGGERFWINVRTDAGNPDTLLYFFRDDGTLGGADFITFGDDGRTSLEALSDGSVSGADPFLALTQPAGKHVFALTRCCGPGDDILDGFQFLKECGSGQRYSSSGSLRPTLLGDIELLAVPEPGIHSQLVLGFLGLITTAAAFEPRGNRPCRSFDKRLPR